MDSRQTTGGCGAALENQKGNRAATWYGNVYLTVGVSESKRGPLLAEVNLSFRWEME